MTNKIPQRILITGDAGRGKSTLASKLSEKLDIPWHSTDDYFYEVKFSQPRERQKSIEEISKLYHADQWIIEGTTQHLLRPGLDLADVIIYLHFESTIHQSAIILKRAFHRGDNLKSTSQMLKHAWYKKRGLYKDQGKVTQLEFIAPYKEKVVMLSSFREINNFVNNF